MLEGAAPRPTTKTLARLPALPEASFRQLAAVLLGAVLAETLLLRIVTRVGVHVPKDESVTALFEAASSAGSLAFNFASVLSLALLLLVLGAMTVRAESAFRRSVIALLSVAMLSGLAMSLATDEPVADAAFGVATALLVAVMLITAAGDGRLAPAAVVAVALVVGAYLSYQYYGLSYLLYRILDLAAVPPASGAVLRLGEVLAVAAAAAAFWAWGRPRWRWVGKTGLAAVAAVLLALTLAALSPVSTMAILALWTTGLSLVLPFPIYLIALALYLLTLVACWRSGDGFWLAAGLLLVLLAGYMAESTYQHVLVLIGVAFLVGSTSRAAPHPADSSRHTEAPAR